MDCRVYMVFGGSGGLNKGDSTKHRNYYIVFRVQGLESGRLNQ